MESILQCPVCGLPLTENEKTYTCPRRHSFDIARQGYVNLLTGGGASHGDNALMVEARRAFLEAGHYAPLADALSRVLTERDTGNVLLDVGCGECYYTARAAECLRAKAPAEVYAFDVSKEALRVGSRRKCGAKLFVASAYDMPVRDASVDLLTLFFSPFCREEIVRVLRPNGLFLMAIPGEEHLWELKEAVYERPYRNQPQETGIEGFCLLEDVRVTDTVHLTDAASIAALFTMTPYYYKTSERDKAKLAALTELKTKIDFHLLVYRRLAP